MLKKLIIGFADFWDGFDPEDNFITDVLRTSFDVEIADMKRYAPGVQYLFFSCFGHEHLKYDCIRIFYTGENITPDFNLCDYAIGFDNLTYGDRYFRYPLYLSCYDDDLKLAATKHMRVADDAVKRKFCCMVVSNYAAASGVRRELFEALSAYRRVDSGGRYLNNIGIPEGVKDKNEFQSQYKFSLAIENSSHPGYMTEKLLQSFAAGTIPIYSGDPADDNIFNRRAYIDLNDYSSYAGLIERVKEIDSDEAVYMSMLREPAFELREVDSYRHSFSDWLLHIFSQEYHVARRRSAYGKASVYEDEVCRLYGMDVVDVEAYPYNLVTEHFINSNQIRCSDTFTIESVSARELITYNRFDLIAKWMYIASTEDRGDPLLAKQIYRESIAAFSNGTFKEGDSDTKNTFERYLSTFDDLIRNIRENGFDGSRSVIPLGANRQIFDGAHRTAVSAYYDRTVLVMRFDKRTPLFEYDYKFFRKRLVPDCSMAYMAKCYMEIKKNCEIICILPITDACSTDDFEASACRCGHIVYEQDIYVTENGVHRLLDVMCENGVMAGRHYDRNRTMKTYICEIEESLPIEINTGIIVVPDELTGIIMDILIDRGKVRELNFGSAFPIYANFREFFTVPRRYRNCVVDQMHAYQIRHNMYSLGTNDYTEFIRIKHRLWHERVKKRLSVIMGGGRS